MMNLKKDHSQVVLIMSILTLTITLLWVYLSVFKALKNSEKPILKPNETRIIVPKLDSEVFIELKKRKI